VRSAGAARREFERAPAAWWQPEFNGLIACRDLGPAPLLASGANEYPACAPIGAGMRSARGRPGVAGRPGHRRAAGPPRRELTSGGDNDIILTALAAGWAVAYFPTLSLTHLIPPTASSPITSPASTAASRSPGCRYSANTA